MTSPLKIYLDSSDFSNLSDSAAASPDLKSIERALLDWQEQGRIELRFSYVHVIEAAPVRPIDVGLAKARLLCIKRLCGPRCFADPFSLLQGEIKATAGLAPDIGWTTRDDGAWYPPFDNDTFTLPTAAAMVREHVETIQPRGQRRASEAVFFDKRGGIRSTASAGIIKLVPAILPQLADQYPLSPLAITKLGSYLTGDESRASVLLSLRDSVADLEWFADWYAKRWDKASPFSESLRRSGESLKETLRAMTERTADLYDRQTVSGIPPQKIEEAMHEAFKGFLERAPEMVGRSICEGLGLDPAELNAMCSPAQTRGLFTMATVMAHVARLTSFIPKGQRKARTSDFGDVFHSLYLPFVDVFRADGFVSNAIADSKFPFTTKIVGNIRQLIPAIEQRLERVA